MWPIEQLYIELGLKLGVEKFRIEMSCNHQKSRDARKVRENQLNLKVSCLENANTVLRNKLQREMKKNQELINELETCQNENDELKQRFSLKKSK